MTSSSSSSSLLSASNNSTVSPPPPPISTLRGHEDLLAYLSLASAYERYCRHPLNETFENYVSHLPGDLDISTSTADNPPSSSASYPTATTSTISSISAFKDTKLIPLTYNPPPPSFEPQPIDPQLIRRALTFQPGPPLNMINVRKYKEKKKKKKKRKHKDKDDKERKKKKKKKKDKERTPMSTSVSAAAPTPTPLPTPLPTPISTPASSATLIMPQK